MARIVFNGGGFYDNGRALEIVGNVDVEINGTVFERNREGVVTHDGNTPPKSTSMGAIATGASASVIAAAISKAMGF